MASADDEIELGRITEAPQWWVCSAVVATVNELETVVVSWECDNKSNPRCGIPG